MLLPELFIGVLNIERLPKERKGCMSVNLYGFGCICVSYPSSMGLFSLGHFIKLWGAAHLWLWWPMSEERQQCAQEWQRFWRQLWSGSHLRKDERDGISPVTANYSVRPR